jgi:phage gpG-like protein
MYGYACDIAMMPLVVVLSMYLMALQALAQMVTNYNGVHSRLCLDEAEVADHVAGLMRSLAECPFKYNYNQKPSWKKFRVRSCRSVSLKKLRVFVLVSRLMCEH